MKPEHGSRFIYRTLHVLTSNTEGKPQILRELVAVETYDRDRCNIESSVWPAPSVDVVRLLELI